MEPLCGGGGSLDRSVKTTERSRLVGRRRCSGLYNGLIGMLTLMTDGTRREEVEGAFEAVVPPPV